MAVRTPDRSPATGGTLPHVRSSAAAVVRQLAPVLVLVSLVAALGLFEPSFLSFYSLTVLAGESSVILLLATAQTVVILLGGIDLSMAALASLASVLIAFALPAAGLLGLLGVLVLTTVLGALQGLIHARAQVPSFVVTLAGMGLCSGAALAISPATIPVAGGYEVVGWLRGKFLGLPVSFLFAAAALALLATLLRWLPLGRHVYAIGMGETAALLSGIRVARTKVLAFALSGLFAALAGMMFVARMHGAIPVSPTACSCQVLRPWSSVVPPSRAARRSVANACRCPDHRRAAGRHRCCRSRSWLRTIGLRCRDRRCRRADHRPFQNHRR